MLFNERNGIFSESHKERNFYFKVFGGCLFNELINNNSELVNKFFIKLSQKYIYSCESYFNIEPKEEVVHLINKINGDAKNSCLHIDFDHHLNQITDNKDKGELADILIDTPSGFLAIEAKLNSDWKFNKDILSNRKRIEDVTNIKKGIQVLLVKRNKWRNCIKKENQTGSNYFKLKNNLQNNEVAIPFILLLWEDILNIIESYDELHLVSEYMKKMLEI